MRIVVVDPNSESRTVLALRIEEALRQTDVRRAELIEGDLEWLTANEDASKPAVGFLGPGCYEDLTGCIAKFRSAYPTAPLAVVLDNEVYASQALELRRELTVRLMPLADIAQMAQFILDFESKLLSEVATVNRGLVTVVQLKGGVGSTTVSAALARCWAEHGLKVALVDLDDMNPHITEWSRAGEGKRQAVAELLKLGSFPAERAREMFHEMGERNREVSDEVALTVIPQPVHYHDSFHFKADILENAPSSAEFMLSLMGSLQDEFDIVVVDSGRSWGISTFALLPISQHVLLVTDDDRTALRRSMDNLARFYRDSDDGDEFNFSRWKIVCNSYTARALSPAEIAEELEALDLFPETAELFTLPFSPAGRDWALTSETLYSIAESSVKDAIADLAFKLIPFRRQLERGTLTKLKRNLQKLGMQL